MKKTIAKRKQKKEPLPEGKVLANPTKSFFVNMLTRDIALMDAIMDLIDNCIDGVHREVKKTNRKPDQHIYRGYYAEIDINGTDFRLTDNCGGIPLDVAKQYAFRLGRSEDDHNNDNLETLGMYGIGMKRAIFKIGMQTEVTTWNNDEIFEVHIPDNWASTPDWSFDYRVLRKTEIKRILKQRGTQVHVSKLHSNISKQFKDESGFLKDLSIAIRNHYGYIIQQGFRITLNGIRIDKIDLSLVTSTSNRSKSIKPYVYTSKLDNVDVEIMIGFYRPLATEDEIQRELSGDFAASISENAGITVLCNDRVVLYCDKTYLTGWGEPPVPKYHTQFIAIAGVVHFRSKTPLKLPVTTTKRGLDTSSAVYASAKNRIKDGLRLFTKFTNEWKISTPERTELFKSSTKINALKPGQSRSHYVTLSSRSGHDGKYQIPDLPNPKDFQTQRTVSITFQKDKDKIDAIRKAFLTERTSASEVGSWCFDRIHSQVE